MNARYPNFHCARKNNPENAPPDFQIQARQPRKTRVASHRPSDKSKPNSLPRAPGCKIPDQPPGTAYRATAKPVLPISNCPSHSAPPHGIPGQTSRHHVPATRKTFRDTNPAPEAAPALSNTVPAAIRLHARTKTRDPPPAAAASAPAQTPNPPASASLLDSNISAPLPGSLPGNKSKPENCWHIHPSDSSPKLTANHAWPQKIASPGTQFQPTRSENAGRPAPSLAQLQTQPSPLPNSASAPSLARDKPASQPTPPAIAQPRAPRRPNFPLRKVF